MKRATGTCGAVKRGFLYFNPRPREEGDLALAVIKSSDIDFNPRPREEGDSADCDIMIVRGGISIHALVKRATRCIWQRH